MRKVTYGAACSLDGFMTGPNGALDWLHFSQDVQTIMTEYFQTIDVMLMGRKTYVAAEAMGGGGGGDDAFAGVETYVFSRTLEALKHPRAHLVRDDAAEFVRQLKRKRGKDICLMGGGELARALFEAQLVDEVGVNTHPVLLGGGIPMFAVPGPRVNLELKASRTISGGCVYSLYRVKRARRRSESPA